MQKRLPHQSQGAIPISARCGLSMPLTHLCALKEAGKLSVNVEQIVIDTSYHFYELSNRKEVMKEYRQF